MSSERYTSSTSVVRTDGVPIACALFGNWRSDGAYSLPPSTRMCAATLVNRSFDRLELSRYSSVWPSIVILSPGANLTSRDDWNVVLAM